jgi:hypothetical protein
MFIVVDSVTKQIISVPLPLNKATEVRDALGEHYSVQPAS